MAPTPNTLFGQQGESIAEAQLMKEGYRIVEKNWRFRHAEIDLIAFTPQNDILVFVEVKLRSTHFFGVPEQAVGKNKMKLLAKAAEAYQLKIKWQGESRFDVFAIVLGKNTQEVQHIVDAFWPFNV